MGQCILERRLEYSNIVSFHNTGNAELCAEHRTILLISHAFKNLLSIHNERLISYIDIRLWRTKADINKYEIWNSLMRNIISSCKRTNSAVSEDWEFWNVVETIRISSTSVLYRWIHLYEYLQIYRWILYRELQDEAVNGVRWSRERRWSVQSQLTELVLHYSVWTSRYRVWCLLWKLILL